MDSRPPKGIQGYPQGGRAHRGSRPYPWPGHHVADLFEPILPQPDELVEASPI